MTTPTARMPYYLAPANANPIFNNIHFSLKALQASEFDVSSYFNENFKNSILDELGELPAANRSEVNSFLAQNINDDTDYKAFLKSIDELKTLNDKALLSNPNAAASLIDNAEEKFQAFLKQQKLKFDQAFTGIPAEKREKLWSNYEKKLSSFIYQPVADFAKQVDPDHLLTQAMRYYVHKVMNNKDANYADLQTGLDQTEFTPRPQFIDSDNRIITTEYDKDGNITSLRVHPYNGNVGDALAIFLASLKEGQKIPPIKIVCPLSNADILKAEMNIGPSLLIILLAHTIVKHIQQGMQRKQILNAAVEKGIPLKHISLEDNRGKPIPIFKENNWLEDLVGVQSSQYKLTESQKKFQETFLDNLPTMTPSR
ncbi:hypothetical protein RVIR1_11370 [Candidatus Rickettsiella viridis]|uniref:Uncharacterized protein n=1 Tax=Candidatus Rickettsiella viridis TaxID=676208 RepID=A0A2Z5UWY3_9COXI|nr:hypothetical protein [Candidatus Rickettsiella viridis]BBB15601.1 hypothetical protein RVIR1_11370 [Candidatus Rickettsiella viridis]